MKTALRLVSVFFALGIAAWAGPTVEDLGWLAGRWKLEKGGRVVEEAWMPPAGGTMLGIGRTVKDGQLREFEFLRLRTDATGDIFYVSLPSGQATAEFKLVRLEGRSVLFENKAHDFPQRISYTLNADGSLLAYIEGESGGKTKRIEFPYRRTD